MEADGINSRYASSKYSLTKIEEFMKTAPSTPSKPKENIPSASLAKTGSVKPRNCDSEVRSSSPVSKFYVSHKLPLDHQFTLRYCLPNSVEK